MKSKSYMSTLASLLTRGLLTSGLLVTLAACNDCDTPPNVPDPSIGSANEPVQAPGVDQTATEERPSALSESQAQQTPPLEQALSAPDDAVTSQGRFSELMDDGLDEYIPETGLVFVSGGAERATTRVVVDADGQVRWARGDGMYWDDLDQKGEVELGEQARKKLADLVERAWTERELEYPPSAADRGELLVLRDAERARVIEGSQLPRQLLAMRELLMDVVQPAKP